MFLLTTLLTKNFFFQKLNSLRIDVNTSNADGLKAENKYKNRYGNIIPGNDCCMIDPRKAILMMFDKYSV